jgi:uncharacterized iron-regulated protein
MLLILTAFLLSVASASAQTADHEGLWDVHARRWRTVQEVAGEARAGDIWVFGEEHATPDNASLPGTTVHHDNQVRFLEALRTIAASGVSVSVGMEFLTYTAQAAVDQFRAGQLSEGDFLKAADWGNSPFAFYRRQILFDGGGKTLALNIPRSITARVSKDGPNSLTADERRLLPPVWELGNAAYFERFHEVMEGHAPENKIQDYFWAQSLWDDTMAWKALEHRTRFPQDILMIVVGSFHVEFGGGLPFELKKLGTSPVKTILQVEVSDWDPSTLNRAVRPDPDYGDAADYLWVHTVSTAVSPHAVSPSGTR